MADASGGADGGGDETPGGHSTQRQLQAVAAKRKPIEVFGACVALHTSALQCNAVLISQAIQT